MVPMTEAWPPLPYEDWRSSKETLHRYLQIAGKVRMALVPRLNHWWHVTLALTTRGVSTGPMPAGDRYAEIAFDLVDHELQVLTSDGGRAGFALADGLACSTFHDRLFAALEDLGVHAEIHAVPYDLGDATPFARDTEHCRYDAEAVARFRQALGDTERVLARFRSGFDGKQSPVALFWHSFDLAHARFTGRPAEVAEDADAVTREAYSQELTAFGFWPGDDRRTPYPAFYSYTWPERAGLTEQRLEPAEASWQPSGDGHLAVLPYDAVRAADDPGATLLAFYERAYAAGGQSLQ
jgi:uncharacterized protein DUF5996